jgi:hypothetical protein
VNTEIKIDLGLASVSDGALAMLEGPVGVASLPAGLCSKLLDALAEEYLRRFGGRSDGAVVLKMAMETLDPDELWHSLRILGNWLSNSDEASRNDPDLEAVSEVIARLWMGARGALSLITDGPVDVSPGEVRN